VIEPVKSSSSLQELNIATEADDQIQPDSIATRPTPSLIETQHMRSHSFDIDYDSRGNGHRIRSSSDGKRKDRRYVSEMALPSYASTGLYSPPSSSTLNKEFSDCQLPESPYDMLTRLFWIGVSLLESDYEHEFLLAIKLIDKVLDSLNVKTSSGIDRVERIMNRLSWPSFPGVQSLLLKGLTSSGTADQTLCLLSKLTTLTNVSVIDPKPSSGLSLNVIALLPRLILNFDDPDSFSKLAATNIDTACKSNDKLHDLGLLMVMYRDKEYSKSVQFWIEVVCKNIIDAYPTLSAHLLALLVEMLEQGPPLFQQPVLNIICAVLKYSDATAPGLKQFHGHLLRIITSHVKDVNLWKDSLSILKLVVSNSSYIQQVNPTHVGITSSQLVQPRGSIGSLLSLTPRLPWGSNLTLGDSSLSLTSQMFKKELPGRTIEFSYNVANTPVIGAKYSHNNSDDQAELTCQGMSAAPCWRKPHGCQRRTRERLVQLLPLCGHKGGLKQSLSVIFSSSSELEGERALSSDDGSSDESADKGENDFANQQLTKIFDDFDFLDDELNKDMEVGSFGWTSTTELHEELIENGHISPCGSESDHVTSTKDDEISADEEEQDSLQRSLPESTLTSLKEEELDCIDSPPNLPLDPPNLTLTPHEDLPLDTPDEQTLNTPDEHPNLNSRPESPSTESAPSRTSTSTSPIVVPKLNKSLNSEDNITGHSLTSQSSFDSNSGAESIIAPPLAPKTDFAVLTYDEIPDRWSKLMASFIDQPSIEEAIDSLPCFPLVLKSWSIWLLRLTRDATHLLGHEPKIIAKLTSIEDALENQLRLPYIFIDKDVFSTGKLLLKHRLTVLKLNVGLQGLQEKREQTQEQLEILQASKNDFSSDDELQELFDHTVKSEESTVMDLCMCLYRLHMQYVMCLEIYLAYVEKIVLIVRDTSKITDVTVDLVSIRSELIASQNSISQIDDSSPGPVMTFKEAAELVSDAVANRHFDEAISILRSYRQRHPSLSTFEIRPDEEVETILSVYARSILKSQSGVFALLGSYEQLGSVCDRLGELLADFISTIYCVHKANKSHKHDESKRKIDVKVTESSPTPE